jgi:WD40 repeat protein
LLFVNRILLAGGAATGVVVALVGCGGSITSPPNGAGTGIVLSPPPPFAIAAAPASATYEACDSLSPPFPIGFLADGRAVVGQYVREVSRGGTLVRAWDPRTNTLERLFAASASANGFEDSLRIDHDGRRIFDITSEEFRVYDVARRGFLTGEAVPVSVGAVSDSGNFVLDGELRRYAASGELDFDFKPLLPPEVRYVSAQRGPLALSFAGDAIALAAWELPGGTPVPVAWVVYQDGRVVRLADLPDISWCSGSTCGLSWSADSRHLLLHADSLRVWEVATGQLIVRLDDGVSSAAFSEDGAHVVTGDGEGNVMARGLSGDATPIQGDPRFAIGAQGKAFGADSSGLIVATRDRIEAHWLQPSYAWPGALALTSDTMFAIVFDWEPPAGSRGFHLMLARFAVDRPGPTAVFRPDESQSEFLGQVALSPDELRVAVAFPDTVRIFDAATLAPLATIPAGAGMIAWSPDGRYLAATPDLHYRDPGRTAYVPAQEITVWNASGTLAARFPTPVYPKAIAFDERGGTLAGWGQPLLTDMASGTPQPGRSPPTLHVFVLGGDAAGFAIDLATSATSTADLPPFVAAARDLIATKDSIVRLSSREALSALPAPMIGAGVFSADFSVLLAADDLGQDWPRVRLLGVTDGRAIATIPTSVGPPYALAVSRGGRRVAFNGDVVCAR